MSDVRAPLRKIARTLAAMIAVAAGSLGVWVAVFSQHASFAFNGLYVDRRDAGTYIRIAHGPPDTMFRVHDPLFEGAGLWVRMNTPTSPQPVWKAFGVEIDIADNATIIICTFLAAFASVVVWRLKPAITLRDICPDCHYDLRATPNRCPECGHVVARATSP